MKKYSLLLIIPMLILILTGCELASPGYAGKIHGVFIGLDYANSTVRDLEGTINDATELAGAFSTLAEAYDMEFEGYLALQEGTSVETGNPLYPTADNLIALFASIGENMNESDILMITYAGHGAGNIAYPDAEGTGYLITAKDDTEEYTVLSIAALSAALSDLPGNKVIILDSCFSGAHVAPYPLEKSDIIGRYDPSQFYLAASQGDELSYESIIGGHNHGYFTSDLLRHLGWDHAGETVEFFHTDSLTLSSSRTINGEILSSWVEDRPASITLEELEAAVRVRTFNEPGIGYLDQEPEITSGPRQIILFH